MVRRLPLVAVGICLSLAVVAASPDVTFVLKSGQRESGQLAWHVGSGDLGVTSNGRERMFPFDDIAVIQFTGGDPSRGELDQLPTADNPPERERHMLVLRNGEVIHGKYHGFTNDQMTFDVWNGSGGVDRRTINLGDVARLYMSGAGARSVFNNILGGSGDRARPGRGRGLGRAGGGRIEDGTEVRVEGNRMWSPTGIMVTARDQVRFTASGEIKLGPDVTATPNGNESLARRRTYPMSSAAAGALIGKVGNGTPFLVGNNTNPITMPATGELFLGVNDDKFVDNSQWFTVRIQR
jgi:hypothetical protein